MIDDHQQRTKQMFLLKALK